MLRKLLIIDFGIDLSKTLNTYEGFSSYKDSTVTIMIAKISKFSLK